MGLFCLHVRRHAVGLQFKTKYSKHKEITRELYKWLGVGRDFSNWIKDRIEKYDFIEDLDYFIAIAKFGDGLKLTSL